MIGLSLWLILNALTGSGLREKEMTITAYCPCQKCCGLHATGRTASGKVAKGKMIAAPKDVPFGTQIFVPGYGWGTVEDRGRAIKGNRLDVLFPTHKEALQWGRQTLTVKIVTSGRASH
jgi:3D (Asp-Asp-Asp) domain-containing protein